MLPRTHLLASLVTMSLAACSTATTTQGGSDDQGGTGGAAGTDAVETSGGTSNAGGTTANAGGATSNAGGTTATSNDLTCSAYCAAVQANCATDSVKQYKSDASCMNSCAAFRLGTTKDVSGNTLGCRAHYAELAVADPASNCSAAGPSGAGHCGTNCDAYCALMATVCPSVFEDETLCRTDCLKMVGIDLATYQIGGAGDNLQCRIYHVTFAAEGFPDVHCPHASPMPMAPCAN